MDFKSAELRDAREIKSSLTTEIKDKIDGSNLIHAVKQYYSMQDGKLFDTFSLGTLNSKSHETPNDLIDSIVRTYYQHLSLVQKDTLEKNKNREVMDIFFNLTKILNCDKTTKDDLVAIIFGILLKQI